MVSKRSANNIEIVTLENDVLLVAIAPAIGGKITSVYNKKLRKEFLWIDKRKELQRLPPGADYDSNFVGGIDELLPNDISETVDGIAYPDHGELWTTALDFDLTDDAITLYGTLPISKLYYRKRVSLQHGDSSIRLDYTIRNDAPEERNFMWKLHAAVAIEAGDKLVTSARHGLVADPEYSRFKKELTTFNWPVVENTDAAIVPPKNNSMDFLYLYDIPVGEMALQSNKGMHNFCIQYDKSVFPFQWYFASYGGFLNHYTAILEPCTNMPISVNDAKEKKQCAVLASGASLVTSVKIYAGETNNLS